MAFGHLRRRPEGEEEAGIKRVADQLVEEGLAELRRRGGAAAQVEPGLLEPEQLEMIDQEGAEQDDPPAGANSAQRMPAEQGAIDVPDDRRRSAARTGTG